MSTVPANISNWAFRHLIVKEGSIPYVYDDADRSRPKKRLSDYSAAKGYPTIGVGHLIRPDEYDRFRPYLKDKTLTPAQTEALLQADIQRISAPLRDKIKAQITQSMWDALILQAFNTGPRTKALREAVAAINNQDKAGARDALLRAPTTSKGITLPALVARRKEEAEIFMRDDPPGAAASPAPIPAGLPPGFPANRHRARLRAQRRKRTRRLIIFGGVALALVSALALREAVTR